MQYDVIYYFTPVIFFSTLRIFYFEMATSKGGGGWICISVVGQQPRDCLEKYRMFGYAYAKNKIGFSLLFLLNKSFFI